MPLSNHLIRQFARAVAVSSEEKQKTTAYGTVVKQDETYYVQLDGSELLTPVTLTTEARHGERVAVLIQDHTAVATGNVSSPAARVDTVMDLDGSLTQREIYNRLTNNGEEQGIYLYGGKLFINADYIDLDQLFAKEITATNSFNVDNGLWIMRTDQDGVTIGAVELRVGSPVTTDGSSSDGEETIVMRTWMTFDRNNINIGTARDENGILQINTTMHTGDVVINGSGFQDALSVDGDVSITGKLYVNGKEIS